MSRAFGHMRAKRRQRADFPVSKTTTLFIYSFFFLTQCEHGYEMRYDTFSNSRPLPLFVVALITGCLLQTVKFFFVFVKQVV